MPSYERVSWRWDWKLNILGKLPCAAEKTNFTVSNSCNNSFAEFPVSTTFNVRAVLPASFSFMSTSQLPFACPHERAASARWSIRSFERSGQHLVAYYVPWFYHHNQSKIIGVAKWLLWSRGTQPAAVRPNATFDKYLCGRAHAI